MAPRFVRVGGSARSVIGARCARLHDGWGLCDDPPCSVDRCEDITRDTGRDWARGTCRKSSPAACVEA